MPELHHWLPDVSDEDCRIVQCPACGQMECAVLTTFWARVTKTDACWLWAGGTNGQGYGRLHLHDGRSVYPHRFSYAAHVGAIPDGACILHRCDRPGCVRPSHLRVGSQRDNTQDMIAKGRARFAPNLARGRQPGTKPAGMAHSRAILTDELVLELRRQHTAGAGIRALARQFGLDSGHVSQVISRKTWRHLP